MTLAGILALTAACASSTSTQIAARGPASPSVASAESDGTLAPAALPVRRPMKMAASAKVVGLRADGLGPNRGERVASAIGDTPPAPSPADEPAEDAWVPILRAPAPAARHAALGRPLTELVSFSSAPFPYSGAQPTGDRFLNVDGGNGQLGHRTRSGRVLWESQTYSDNRVLLHVPAGFDPDRPSVMVVFFHGFGATLSRDVLKRQQVPAQISASGANAVLVAPQFAFDARDSSAGRFWEPGGFSRFLAEASAKLARLQGDPAAEPSFASMPVVLVAYSGGFLPAAFCLRDESARDRVRGVVLLDAVYGETDTFANWSAGNRSGFLVSGYTHYTRGRNGELARKLAERGVPSSTRLIGSLSHGGVSFLAADYPHQDYVTRAWTDEPIRDILMRLPEIRLRDSQTVASIDH